MGGRAQKRPGGRDPKGSKRSPTPIFVSSRVMVLIIVLGLAALAYVLYAAPGILVVALGGAALAIVLSYPVRALSRVMPRPLAILLTFLILIGLVVSGFVFLAAPLIEQSQSFIRTVPAIANSVNGFFVDLLEGLAERDLLPVDPQEFVNDVAGDLTGRVQDIVQGALGGLVGFVTGALNFGITLFGILFVAAYLLVDIRKMKAAYLRAAPRGYRRDAHDLWDAFGVSLSRYLGGLIFVVLIQGVLAALALWALGVRYAILLGVWVSVTAIIPYFGAFLGAIPAIIVALIFGSTRFDPGSTTTVTVLTVVAYVLIQQLEGNFLTPPIQGQALHVHPILVLLAVIGGGQLARLPGVGFAVPALAVLRLFYDFFRVRLRRKPAP